MLPVRPAPLVCIASLLAVTGCRAAGAQLEARAPTPAPSATADGAPGVSPRSGGGALWADLPAGGVASAGESSTEPAPVSPRPTPTAGDPPLAGAFSFARPFAEGLEQRGSAFFPYGTDAGGQYLLHHGIDIGNPLGTPVLAVGDGVVVYAGDDSQTRFGPETDFYGKVVVVAHRRAPGQGDAPPPAALFSLYGHLSAVAAEAGEAVSAGRVVGLLGATGVALGPHLHLEFRTEAGDYERTVNPALFLRPLPGTGTIAGRLLTADGALLASTPIGLYRLADGGWMAGTVTYPAAHVNPAPGWDENFVFADVPAGDYSVVPDAASGSRGAVVTVGASAATRVTLSPP